MDGRRYDRLREINVRSTKKRKVFSSENGGAEESRRMDGWKEGRKESEDCEETKKERKGEKEIERDQFN